jgi:hypothetical protein
MLSTQHYVLLKVFHNYSTEKLTLKVDYSNKWYNSSFSCQNIKMTSVACDYIPEIIKK